MKPMIKIICVLFLCFLAFNCKKSSDNTNNAPTTPGNPTPADAAIDISLSPVLSWSCSDPDGDSLKYIVYFSSVNPPNTLIDSNLTNASYAVSGLEYNKTYYWRVNAKDSISSASPGPIWRFTTLTNNAPTTPGNPMPADAAVEIPISPVLSWSCNDPDGDSIRYEVYLSTDNPPNMLIASNLNAASYAVSSLESVTTYYWRIVAIDSKDFISPGPIWQFTTLLDFRDEYVGNYKCMQTYIYFCPVGDMNFWCTDTISFNHEITIQKIADSSLKIRIHSYYSFEAKYTGNKKFTCMECNGPPDYVRFYDSDSMNVYERDGEVNCYEYYGKKE
jgi:hypothetical protein